MTSASARTPLLTPNAEQPSLQQDATADTLVDKSPLHPGRRAGLPGPDTALRTATLKERNSPGRQAPLRNELLPVRVEGVHFACPGRSSKPRVSILSLVIQKLLAMEGVYETR
jgi:hypothetical protein